MEEGGPAKLPVASKAPPRRPQAATRPQPPILPKLLSDFKEAKMRESRAVQRKQIIEKNEAFGKVCTAEDIKAIEEDRVKGIRDAHAAMARLEDIKAKLTEQQYKQLNECIMQISERKQAMDMRENIARDWMRKGQITETDASFQQFRRHTLLIAETLRKSIEMFEELVSKT